MSFSAFLGYLIKVKKDSVEKLFEELKQYLDASDFSGSPNVSLNTSLENDKVYEKVMKAKIEDDTDLILSYSDGGSEDIQRYYDKLKEQEDELNEQKRNYTLSPMKSNDSFTEEADTVSIKSITDKLSKGTRASANDIISDVEELVEVALRKLNRYQSREIELEDQLFFLQLDTFLYQLVQRNDMGEYWILRLNELKDVFSDELQVKQPDYKMYQSELLRDNIRARGNINDLLFLDMGEKAKLASLIDAEDEHDGSEISENESNIVPLIIDEENIILPRIVQEPEPDEPQLPLQIPEKILHGTPVSEDERANPFATYQEELSSDEEEDNIQDYSSSDVENEDRTGNEDLDSEYETEEEKRARLFKKEQRRRERELKAKKEEEDAYEFEYTEEVTESHSPNHALHMQQLEQLELLQKNYSESQLSQIQSLVKHQEELYEIQKRRIRGSRFQDLISDGTPTRKERNLKLIEVEEDADDTDWRTGSILEDAYFKSELFEMVTQARAEFEREYEQ
jgi:hypothetical protein